MIMREIGPRITIGAVILAHSAPLTITDIRPPFAPLRGRVSFKALSFDSVLQRFADGLGRHLRFQKIGLNS
jgi:hypothetical protein